MMERLEDAMNVTVECINKVGNHSQIKPQKRLLSFGIDNALIPSLKDKIANDEEIGLPSVRPDPYTIDEDLLTITENSTVNAIFNKVFHDAVKA